MIRNPEIIISGVVGDITYKLKQRGFIPYYSIKENEKEKKQAVLVSLTPKLFTKIAIEKNYPIVTAEKSSRAHFSRIVSCSLPILYRLKEELIKEGGECSLDEVWMVHNESNDKDLQNETGLEYLDDISNFYGTKIAIYFAWLKFYTTYLTIPALFGVLLYCYQVYYDQLDTEYNIVYMFIMMVWCTCWFAFWKRENNLLSFNWDVLDADTMAINEALVEASESANRPDRTMRYAVTIPTICIMIGSIIWIMLYFMVTIDEYSERTDLYKYIPTVLYSIFPSVAGVFYGYVVVHLNNFEMHLSQFEKDDSLIKKQFIFHFVNRFGGLFYVAFYKQDIEKLRNLLASMLIVHAIINNVMELFSPLISGIMTKISNRILKGANAEASFAGEGVSLITAVDNENANNSWKNLVINEMSRDAYNLSEDYLEMMMQYGYCTMFVVVFPIAPALAYLNNLFETTVDLKKFLCMKRPTIVDRSNIGSWETCLNVINFTSVITNCFLLCMVSNSIKKVVPVGYETYTDEVLGKFVLMVILEHLIMMLKGLLMHVIEVIPIKVQESVAKTSIESNKMLTDQRFDLYNATAINKLNGGKQQDSELLYEKMIASNKITNEYAATFGYNPLLLIGVVTAPVILTAMNVSPYWYIPISVLFFSYLKTDKDRKDRRAAAGIVLDDNVMKYVLQLLPSWIKFGDVERVGWLNNLLDTLWPYISNAVEKVVKGIVQPILDSYASAAIGTLTLEHCNLGTFPPKIVGVRNIKSDDSVFRLDVDLLYCGNPGIVLEVGRKPLPLSLEVGDVFFKGKLRVELAPLISVLPCFGSLSVCFMHKPVIDFSLKVASVDVMSLGPGDNNISSIVSRLIVSILHDLMIYPNKIIIPIVNPQPVEVVSSTNTSTNTNAPNQNNSIETNNQAPPPIPPTIMELTPVGVLHMTILSATDLVIADILTSSSDPYVVIKCLNEEYKTHRVRRNLNPVWNEKFSMLIYDKETQFVELSLFDADEVTISKDDFLGSTTVELDKLPNNESKVIERKLQFIKHGSVKVSCTYKPVQKKIDGFDPLAKDIVFSYSKAALSTDILMEDTITDNSDANANANAEEETRESAYASETTGTGTGTGIETVRDERKNSIGMSFSKLANMITPIQRLNKASKSENPIPIPIPIDSVSSAGILKISNIKCRNLVATRSMTHSFKPYVSLSVINKNAFVQKKNTSKKHNIRDPVFEEIYNFVVDSAGMSSIHMRVMDDYMFMSNVMLGDIHIDISKILSEYTSIEQNAFVLENEYILSNVKNNESYLSCKLSWSPTD